MGTCPQCNAPVITPKTHRGFCSTACRTRASVSATLATGKRKPAKRATRPRKPTELQEQLHLAHWLDASGVLWCHVPNGELRSWSVARRLKTMGVKAGVPDILIFTPPPVYPKACGVAIELKRQGVLTCTPEQKAWMAELKAVGWAVALSAGAKNAIEWLEALGYHTT